MFHFQLGGDLRAKGGKREPKGRAKRTGGGGRLRSNIQKRRKGPEGVWRDEIQKLWLLLNKPRGGGQLFLVRGKGAEFPRAAGRKNSWTGKEAEISEGKSPVRSPRAQVQLRKLREGWNSA